MFARYHTAIDKNRLQTLVAAVYHRIQYFLSYKIHSMVPSQTQHRLRWTPVDSRESWRFQLRYVGFQIELLLERRLLSRRRFVFLLLATNRLCGSIVCLLRSIFIVAFNNLNLLLGLSSRPTPGTSTTTATSSAPHSLISIFLH